MINIPVKVNVPVVPKLSAAATAGAADAATEWFPVVAAPAAAAAAESLSLTCVSGIPGK